MGDDRLNKTKLIPVEEEFHLSLLVKGDFSSCWLVYQQKLKINHVHFHQYFEAVVLVDTRYFYQDQTISVVWVWDCISNFRAVFFPEQTWFEKPWSTEWTIFFFFRVQYHAKSYDTEEMLRTRVISGWKTRKCQEKLERTHFQKIRKEKNKVKWVTLIYYSMLQKCFFRKMKQNDRARKQRSLQIYPRC